MESMNDMLVKLTNNTGGTKRIGSMLWPELTADAAQRKLLDCLNPERPAKLDPEQVLFLMRHAREMGDSTPIEFLCRQLHYMVPQPIQPRDEAAELQRKFIAATEELSKMAERIRGLKS